jgi:hypothetical protein
MKKSLNTSSNAFQNKRQVQDKQFNANIQYFETTVKAENIEPKRIVIISNMVWIKDQNGNIRQTEQGTQFKVNIENGQIRFDKPLKFKNNG